MTGAVEPIAVTSLSSNGQIGMPKKVREKLKLNLGDDVAYIEDPENGDIIVRKAKTTTIMV